MQLLDYSDEALNVISRFHSAERMVYVEGDDDILFWDVIFSSCSTQVVRIESVDGSDELDRYIQRIIHSDLNVIAARDRDHLEICGALVSHPRVLYTYGHSIENCLYNPPSVVQIARPYCKLRSVNLPECREWFERLFSRTERLITFDATNMRANLSISVMGDNCTRFMQSNELHEVSTTKVNHFCDALQIPNHEVEITVGIFSALDVRQRRQMRGHFLASAVLKYVTKLIADAGRATRLTYDGLYALAIEVFRGYFASYANREYYCAAANNALTS